MKKTTEQWRAKSAWEQVNELKKDQLEEFSAIADGASSLIQKTGLGQAIAFWLAKGNKNLILANFLAEWLLKDLESNVREKGKSGEKLMEKIINISSSDYRMLTNEAVAYLFWLKRFAKALKKAN